MARLRMRSSDLKGHLPAMKIIESSACSCGFKNEDEIHFFLHVRCIIDQESLV